jgi:hypothetical protein
MTVTLNLPPEREEALRRRAEACGVTVEQLLDRYIEQLAPSKSIAHLQTENPAEWIRQVRAWTESHDRTTPLLSDEDISRESIYPDRV